MARNKIDPNLKAGFKKKRKKNAIVCKIRKQTQIPGSHALVQITASLNESSI